MTSATDTEVGLDLLEDDLTARIRALGLERHAADLALQGYTVVENVASPAFIDRLRAQILEVVQPPPAPGEEPTIAGTFEDSAWMLLGTDPVFEEAVCNPRFVALNELMLGKGFRIGTCGATVKRRGSGPLFLHTDHIALGIREPYPQQCEVLTSLWTCDDWTIEGGCTRIVPRSCERRRAPRLDEAEIRAVPIECPKGSLIMWDGASWHGNCERTIDGERVSLHTPCAHLSRYHLESYAHLGDEVVDRNPAVFRRMLGLDAPFGKQTTASPPMAEMARMWEWMAEPSYP
jgi:ectoine hydroxylase-related dioxygenase (phytanoyl-CoA dioxygenase family)